MNEPNDTLVELTLTPASAEAVDAYFASRADDGFAVAADSGITARVASLLDQVGAAPGARNDLATRTLERVVGRGALGEHVLADADVEALDALLIAQFDARRVPGTLRPRAEKIAALSALVVEPPAARPSADLGSRTFAKVAARMSESPLPFEPRRLTLRGRWRDVVSVAAVLLIGASVVWPVMSSVRREASRSACLSNMHASATGLAAYADANRDTLPVLTAGFGGGSWWNVGTPGGSNSANIFTLAREHYVGLDDLACPGNPEAPTALAHPEDRDWRALPEVSYSYRIMPGPMRVHSGAGDVAILADRSPVVLRAVRGDLVDPLENSPNHLGTGQHVLFASGRAAWMDSPEVEGRTADGQPTVDNIWLPRRVERALDRAARQRGIISGRELPTDTLDSFVGP
ncbi:MAG: hypothetical protein IT439_00065 [Phycisphaerales bacterium]|nr:hypothetical protein [Phycisphaerales bacterium]